MAKKKTDEPKVYKEHPSVDQRITDTLRENYMPYAMSVIVSRAIPEIDGFKPSHRKLLYTMYKMGLLNGNRTKSANIVGQTMKLNPHGDAAIYETMVRLTRGNEALLMPFVDSKGNFGKVYSRDMAYAAPRYTEAKLDAFCAELFRDIDTDAVDFVDNYEAWNHLLVELFKDILDIEEKAVITSEFKDITNNDMHIMEAVGKTGAKNMSAIAKALSVTVGTLTIAVNNLVKKGYVQRVRSEKDRRVVLVSLTEKGRRAFDHHQKFHHDMIEAVIHDIPEDEMEVLGRALRNLTAFFHRYQK